MGQFGDINYRIFSQGTTEGGSTECLPHFHFQNYTHKTHIWLSIGLCETCRKGGGVRKGWGVIRKGANPRSTLTTLAL